MRAISIWQPWASAMAKGLKRVETRSWPTSYRGDLVICSAKNTPQPELFESAEDYRAALKLPLGFALCVVDLYACLPVERVVYHLGTILYEREQDWGDYTPGRHGWCTRNRRELKTPVPVVGRQGLWSLPEDLAAKIKEQLP